MLLLQYPDHVWVVYAHPLYQVLVMPLSPRLALQRVLNLLLQSAVVTIQRLYTFLCTFILASKFLNEFSLGASNMLLLSYVISKLFILRLYLFKVIICVLISFKLPVQIINSRCKISFRGFQVSLQIVDFCSVSFSLPLIEWLQFIYVFFREIVLVRIHYGRSCSIWANCFQSLHCLACSKIYIPASLPLAWCQFHDLVRWHLDCLPCRF